MKRIFTFGLMLASVFALTNCTEELVDQTVPSDEVTQETVTPEEEGIPFQVYASLGAETKTVGEKTADEKLKTNWDSDDQISVFYAEVDNFGAEGNVTSAGNFKISNTDEGIFEGFLPNGIEESKTYNWYFVYDASKKVGISSNKINVNIGLPEQTQTGAGSTTHIGEASNCLMMGTALKLSGSIIPRVRMKHCSALVALKVINQGDGTDNGQANIKISNLTFSVTEAKDADGKSVKSVPIVGVFSTTLTGSSYVAVSSSNYVTLNLSSAVEIEPTKEATFYMAIRPFDKNLKVSELEVGINTSAISEGINVQKRKITITPNENHFNAGTITTVQVPVKLEHPKESDAVTAGFVSFSNKTNATLSVNGENVSAYKVGTKNNQGSITITGNVAELMNALPAGFYVSYYEGQNTAMTVTNLDLNIKNDDGGYSHFTEYPGLEEAITGQLQQEDDEVTFTLNLGIWQKEFDATDTAVKIVMGTLETGIPRDASMEILNLKPIGLTEFIAPSTITFTKILSNGASEGKDILFLDESPIHKQIGSDAINNLFKSKFPGATYEGLIDISNGRNTPSAITTSEVLYSVINKQFSYDANNELRKVYVSKEIDALGQKVTIKAYIELKAIMDVFIKDAASLRSLLPKLNISLTIGTYPYSDNPEDYGTKRAPSQPNIDYYPLIFWGLDAYGN